VTEEAGRQDAGIVKDQQITRAEQVRELSEAGILEGAGVAVEVEHTRGSAIGKRLLRDQLLGKVEIELRNQHCSIIGGAASVFVGDPPKGGVV
jgi:hypothetical protein